MRFTIFNKRLSTSQIVWRQIQLALNESNELGSIFVKKFIHHWRNIMETAISEIKLKKIVEGGS